MRRSWVIIVPVLLWVCVFVMSAGATGRTPRQASGGWTIPATAAAEKSPLKVDATIVANGKKLFASKCERCHGTKAKGDGPDGDPEHMDDMDLTVASRATRNPDGVVFYKIWNGRTTPKMPAFSEEISKEQAWTIVSYVQTLRAK